MSLLFITIYESDIPLAVHLAKRGSEILFYSPNPYIASQALKHSIKTHYNVNKPEFIRLCAEGRFKTIQQLPNVASQVWINVNTVKDGSDTYADAENLIAAASQKISKTEALTITGLTKPGEASKLIQLFHRLSRCPECPALFIGSPQTIMEKTPAWTNDVGAQRLQETINVFNPCFYDNVESAEYATIAAVASDAVRRTTLLHLLRHFKNTEFVQNCLNDNVLLKPEHIDILKHLKYTLGVSGVHSNVFTNSYKALVKEVARRESEMVRDVLKLARKSGRITRILVVCFEDTVVERLQSALAKKNVKTVYVDESGLEVKGVEMCKGFDGVVVATHNVALLKQFEQACKRVWFIPTI